jgi:hypothetical protein
MGSFAPSGPIPRRAVLAGALALAAPRLAWGASMPARLSFQALRNGHPIGEQQMSFEVGPDGLTAHTVAEIAVKIGPITAYRYRHEATERWTDDRFAGLDTETNDNGKVIRVSARRAGDQVQIVTPAGETVTAPAGTLPFTHWNRRIAAAPLFNPQDGKLLRETASPAGSGAVKLASGALAPAERLVFRGDAYIDDWYDSGGVWTGLTGKLKDGSMLEYRRL